MNERFAGVTSRSIVPAPAGKGVFPVAITVLAFAAAVVCMPALTEATTVIADAGPDQYRYVGETVQLDGSATDPDGQATEFYFLWSFNSMPDGSGATLSRIRIPDPVFEPDLIGDYLLTLTVSDDQGNIDSDNVTIYVSDPAVIPEPVTMLGVLFGVVGLAGYVRKRRRVG